MGKHEVFELLSILLSQTKYCQALVTQQTDKSSNSLKCNLLFTQWGNVYLVFDLNEILVYLRPWPDILLYFWGLYFKVIGRFYPLNQPKLILHFNHWKKRTDLDSILKASFNQKTQTPVIFLTWGTYSLAIVKNLKTCSTAFELLHEITLYWSWKIIFKENSIL